MTVIMISAMFENGGNVTHRLLDGHPELLVYPFESQVGTPFVNDHLASIVPARYRWPVFPLDGSVADDYELFLDEELRTLLRTPERSRFRDAGLEMDEADRRRAFEAYLAARPRTRRNLVLAYFDSAFSAWRNLQRSGRERAFAGFNPCLVLDTAAFFADFPEGHLIHVVRHPASAYADTRTRPSPWSLDRYGWTWSVCQQAAFVAREQHPDRVHLIRLEDLVADPEATLRPLLQRMGFGWSDCCRTPSFNGRPLRSVAPWGVIGAATPEAAAARGPLEPADRARLAALTRFWCEELYESATEPPAGAAPTARREVEHA